MRAAGRGQPPRPLVIQQPVEKLEILKKLLRDSAAKAPPKKADFATYSVHSWSTKEEQFYAGRDAMRSILFVIESWQLSKNEHEIVEGLIRRLSADLPGPWFFNAAAL